MTKRKVHPRLQVYLVPGMAVPGVTYLYNNGQLGQGQGARGKVDPAV